MSWDIVPLSKWDFGYFDRQRDLFSEWLHLFDDDWRMGSFEESRIRFDKELDKIRREMLRMDEQPVNLDLRQPFITDPKGQHKFSLRFNCSKFKPNEITVQTQDNTLKVHARHAHEEDGRKFYQEFFRECTLPENVDPKKLQSSLTNDGVLQIEAPVQPTVVAPKEHLIPIDHLKKDLKKDKQVVAVEKERGDGK
ncbi:heat shock protein 27-like [Ruditapes philippinarum]|uniref:heat shock protein 27-like n=1 Tax=Ruditapes philippinarum TaxID=129788 RepID=UPI00295C2D6A|nr:heat shock protein 27-like [Ruditapes philippinarum]XP_060565377.1 heat shock protein 27-like [Ruditapes philippinarum]